MKAAVEKGRQSDPAFFFAKDGVHPNAAGQAVIAQPLAKAWGLKLTTDGLPEGHAKGAELIKVVAEKQNVLKLAWLTATKHVRPGIPAGLPLDEAEKKAAELDEKARSLK